MTGGRIHLAARAVRVGIRSSEESAVDGSPMRWSIVIPE